MSAEVVQFLNTKFVNSLPEDVPPGQNQVPLSKTFKDLKLVLQKKLDPSMVNPIRDDLMDCLYRLNFALAKCQRIQEKRKKRKIHHFTVSEVYLLFNIKRELSRIKQKIQGYPEDSTIGSGANGSRSNKSRKSAHVFGFDDRKEAIIKVLEKKNNDGINVVGIVGMCGTGKSTLAQLVYDDDKVKMEFMPRIWIPLFSQSDTNQESTTNIVRYLLNELGEDSDDGDNDADGEIHDDDDDRGNGRQIQEDERGGAKDEEKVKKEEIRTLLAALYKQLSGKKYLIVFDDAWHINSWYENLLNDRQQSNEHLGLPKGHGGGIIVTSRLDEDVRGTVGNAHLHPISPTLHRDHCWSIFIKTIEANGISSDHQTLVTMKEEIIDNCKGLPLAAKTLGNIISKKIGVEERTSQDITTSNV
ncbi:hypothetical protein ACHQM5_026723 [Ranunculus cassubicifolius]